MTRKSGKFLKHVEDNFLSQVFSKPTRKDAFLHLLFLNREGLMEDVMGGGCLARSGHKMVKFNIFGLMGKKVCRLDMLDFKRVNLKATQGAA